MINFLIDWLLANQVVLWLVVALFCLFFEMGSPGLFFFLSFFFGALAAAVCALVTFSWMWQSAVFVVCTGIAFWLLHLWVRKRSKSFDMGANTNIYAMRSKRGRVKNQIGPHKMGRVKIDGEIWSARSVDGQVIKEGEVVSVVRVKGAHVVVQKVKDKTE